MSRTAYLLSMLCFLLLMPAPVLAQNRDNDVIFQSGNIKVRRQTIRLEEGKALSYHTLLRDNIHFGLCYADAEHRRIAGTYYHPQGPLGMVMQKFNWFPGPINTYFADVRLPASLVALGSPLAQLTALWSEPPVAIIGLEAGTSVSYVRPGQHVHIYEPAKELIDLHETKDKDRWFHFIHDARQRGTVLSIIQGPPRQQLKQRGPGNFYHVMVLEACSGENGEKIFLEFFTKEGIAQCLEHLVEDGVLCVHTSHRFLDLPKVLTAIGDDLKLHVLVGHDNAPGARFGDGAELAEIGHFTSEWVMLSRKKEILDAVCKEPPNYAELMKKDRFGRRGDYWSSHAPLKQVWTDKGPNLLHGVLRGHPFTMRYSAAMEPVADFLGGAAKSVGLGVNVERSIRDMSRLPYGVEQWMVQSQLKTNPQVEKLWP